MFLLRRSTPLGNGHPAYVAPSGSDKAYVTRQKARRFQAREQAEAERCGNESIEEES